VTGLHSSPRLIVGHQASADLEVNPERSESRSDASAGFTPRGEPRLLRYEDRLTDLFQDANGDFYLVPVDPGSELDCDSCQ